MYMFKLSALTRETTVYLEKSQFDGRLDYFIRSSLLSFKSSFHLTYSDEKKHIPELELKYFSRFHLIKLLMKKT